MKREEIVSRMKTLQSMRKFLRDSIKCKDGGFFTHNDQRKMLFEVETELCDLADELCEVENRMREGDNLLRFCGGPIA